MRLLAIALLIVPMAANAATWNAASAYREDVGVAITNASDGDTVSVPFDRVTWTNGLVWSKGISVIFDSTDITMRLTNSNGRLFEMNTVAGKSYRLSGFSLQWHSACSNSQDGLIYVGGSSTNVRLSSISSTNVGTNTLGVIYWMDPFGVIDHCWMDLTGGSRAVMFNHNTVFAGNDNGDASWENAIGDRNAVFVEDCTFYRTSEESTRFLGAFDGWFGGRLVVRHCNLTNVHIGNHGTESAQRDRGGRQIDVYWCNFGDDVVGQGWDSLIHYRSGTGNIYSNTVNGSSANFFIKTDTDRSSGSFPPWGSADGTKAWDAPDLTDGAGTPGGAGDGIFESGASTSSGSGTLTQSTKSWTDNQWFNYTLRAYTNYTSTSGGVRSATVSGAGWTVNQWAGYEFTKSSDDTKGQVSSNTSDTLTLRTDFYAVDMTGGGDFVLSKASLISANTATTLTVYPDIESGQHSFLAVTPYEIRKTLRVLDDPGLGVTTAISGTPPNHQSLGQTYEKIYYWGNSLTLSINQAEVGGQTSSSRGGLNWTNLVNPSYVEYTYPHPLVSEAAVSLPAGRRKPRVGKKDAAIIGPWFQVPASVDLSDFTFQLSSK